MNIIQDFFRLAISETITVPVWTVVTLLTISALCQLLRAVRAGIFIIYVITLHLAWEFLKIQEVSMLTLILCAFPAALLLIVGFINVLMDP